MYNKTFKILYFTQIKIKNNYIAKKKNKYYNIKQYYRHSTNLLKQIIYFIKIFILSG